MMDEISHDLVELSSQLNNSLVPVMSALPDGSIETTVDAFTNGLDGKNLYTDSTATESNNSAYFNIAAGRPYTVYEQCADIYTRMSAMQSELETSIADLLQEASMVTIDDVGGLYTSSHVEGALTEVMEKVNLIALGQIDLESVTSHYIPASADTFDLGTSSVALRYVYPNVVYLKPRTSAPPAYEGALYYDSITHKLNVYNGTTWKVVQFE